MNEMRNMQKRREAVHILMLMDGQIFNPFRYMDNMDSL